MPTGMELHSSRRRRGALRRRPRHRAGPPLLGYVGRVSRTRQTSTSCSDAVTLPTVDEGLLVIARRTAAEHGQDGARAASRQRRCSSVTGRRRTEGCYAGRRMFVFASRRKRRGWCCSTGTGARLPVVGLAELGSARFCCPSAAPALHRTNRQRFRARGRMMREPGESTPDGRRDEHLRPNRDTASRARRLLDRKRHCADGAAGRRPSPRPAARVGQPVTIDARLIASFAATRRHGVG